MQHKIRGPKLLCAEEGLFENTVNIHKYIWPQHAGHAKYHIIKIKWILMAVIQHKSKP